MSQDKPPQPKATAEGATTVPKLEEVLPREGECDVLVELTWAGVLRLMTGALPPDLVLKLLSDMTGNGFDGMLYEQLHGVLTQLAQIQSRQR